jgi:hypothetical protein
MQPKTTPEHDGTQMHGSPDVALRVIDEIGKIDFLRCFRGGRRNINRLTARDPQNCNADADEEREGCDGEPDC